MGLERLTLDFGEDRRLILVCLMNQIQRERESYISDDRGRACKMRFGLGSGLRTKDNFVFA